MVFALHIGAALEINISHKGNSSAAGRAKVIATQLNSVKREEICGLQGIDYSFSSLFGCVEPILLPNILALTCREHGQNELYRMLLVTAPDLTSLLNRTLMMKDAVAEKSSQIADLAIELANVKRKMATLTAEVSDLNERLKSESG